jgi:hypothetical protein
VSLVLLAAAAAADGAVCLDGTPGGVYVDVGAEASFEALGGGDAAKQP